MVELLEKKNRERIECWIDISVVKATDSMRLGEIISRSSFQLYEAMSAFELMDPKMDPDAGNRTTHPQETTQTCVASSIEAETLTLPGALGLSLRLLAAETAWNEGNSLAETIFTCVLFERGTLEWLLEEACSTHECHAISLSKRELDFRPLTRTGWMWGSAKSANNNHRSGDIKTIDPHPLLWQSRKLKLTQKKSIGRVLVARIILAILMSCLKTVQLSSEIITHADIYEEEDFTPNLQSSFELCDMITDSSLLQLLEGAKKDLISMHTFCSAEMSTGDAYLEYASVSPVSVEVPLLLAHFLTFRINYFKALFSLSTASAIRVSLGCYSEAFQCCQNAANALSLLRGVCSNVARERIESSSAISKNTCGKKVVKSIAAMVAYESDSAMIFFNASRHKEVFGVSPSRTLCFGSDERSLDIFSFIVSGTAHASRVLSADNSFGQSTFLLERIPQASDDRAGLASDSIRGRSIRHIRPCKSQLQKEKPSMSTGVFPSIVHRSLIAGNLFFDNLLLGSVDMLEYLVNSMVDDGVPSAVVYSEVIRTLLARALRLVYDTLRMYTLNRCRQRARIETLLLEWKKLQIAASCADEEFESLAGICENNVNMKFCTDWVTLQTLKLMQRHIELGVRLDLFLENEIAHTYWYWQYLLNWTLQIMTKFKVLRRQLKVQLAKDEASISSKLIDADLIAKAKCFEAEKNQELSNNEDPKKSKRKNNSPKKGGFNVNLGRRENDIEEVEYLSIELKLRFCRGLYKVYLCTVICIENTHYISSFIVFYPLI